MRTTNHSKCLKVDLRIDQGGNENSALPDLSLYHFIYNTSFSDLDWQICVVRKQLPGKIIFFTKIHEVCPNQAANFYFFDI